MTDTTNAVPNAIRRVETADAVRLAGLVGAYDDLQTVLRCCERLMTLLASGGRADDADIEALWTLALLSYGRAFAGEGAAAPVSEDDLTEPADDGEVQRAHRVLLHLRDHHAHASLNPREVYSVGVAQGEDGSVNAVAVTSISTPPVDAEAVRQLGGITFPLCGLLDQRIGELQETLLAALQSTSASDLEAMELIEVAAAE